jgi:hypothetical protein
MEKLAPATRRVARLMIAGLLAWALALLGFVSVSPARPRATPVAVGADFQLCGDEGGERHDSPERHALCSCCIPGRSGQPDDDAELAAELPKRLALSIPVADRLPAERVPVLEAVSPPGWTSSWSQRAPPRRS